MSEQLRAALAAIEEAHERGRRGTLGPTGVNYALMLAEAALREALAVVEAADHWEEVINHRFGATGGLLDAEDALADAVDRMRAARLNGATS